MSHPLSTHTQGRDNNFNLLRLLAATLVLYSHCFSLTGQLEPARTALGMSIGSIAVDIFFALSGFLVCGSLLARSSLLRFARARALRIFPGLIASVAFTVFILGPYFTTLDLGEYLVHRQTWTFFVKNCVAVLGVSYPLPGVFTELPYPNTVNGSLWTLPWEVRMYVMLGTLGLLFRRAGAIDRRRFELAVLTLLAGALTAYTAQHLVSPLPIKNAEKGLRLMAMFCCGAAFMTYSSRIPVSGKLATSCATALLLSGLTGAGFLPIYICSVGYLSLFLAYVPSGRIRVYNKLGDYSYGMYIYAFPLQQATVTLMPGSSVAQLFAITFPATMVLAVLSWHLIEKAALKLK